LYLDILYSSGTVWWLNRLDQVNFVCVMHVKHK
jgi:hypothetical protein